VKVQAAGDVKVSATASTAEGDASATSAGGGAVNVGAAYATLEVKPTVNAWIGGGTTSVKAGGNISVTGELKQRQTNPQAQDLTDELKHSAVNVGTDEITFKQHGLQTGDAVVYDPNGQASIKVAGQEGTLSDGTATNGRDYGVIRVTDNTIKLGGAFNGGAVDAGGPFALPAGTSGVDVLRDVIVFGGPHHFVTGDAVFYDNAGGTFGSVATNGQKYFVRVIDDRTIKLTTSLAAALATPTGFNATAGGLITNGNQLNVAGFADGDKVTYRAPAAAGFSSKVVDANVNESDKTTTDVDNNQIYLGRDTNGDGDIDVGHGFQTGDRVTYRTNGTAIGGPVDGVDCFVIKVDDFRLQLVASLDATNPDDDGNGPHVGVTPINLVANKTDAGTQVKHALVPQTLAGLTNGATYTVVSSDADTFRLRDSNGVIVPSIGVGSATGTHFLGKEGIELDSAGGSDRNHTLRIDITGVIAGAVNLLLGAGGVSLRQISPPIGDGQSSASAQGGSGGAISVDVPTANATFHADVQASVDADLVQAGGDVTISSVANGRATAYASSASGGFVQVGAANSSVDYTTASNAVVGHAAPGKTIAGITTEQGSPQVVADGVNITAGGHVRVLSQNGGNASVGAGAAGGGSSPSPSPTPRRT
jgi:hypothetical protein